MTLVSMYDMEAAMTRQQDPPISEAYGDSRIDGAAWALGIGELEGASTYWLATVHPSGRPHVVPVLGVVHDGSLYFAAGPRTQKARNLSRGSAVTVTTHGEALDVVLEGSARRVTTPAVLAAVADAYVGKYGWETTVQDGALHAEGAPTAGPPPFHVFVVVPARAFGFPTTDDAPPTRWRFTSPRRSRGW